MRRHTSRRQNRGNERQTVRGAGHVAIGEARTIVPERAEQPERVAARHRVPSRGDVHSKWFDLLAFYDRHPRTCGLEMCTVVGGVQLATESSCPAAITCERWEQRGRSIENYNVRRSPQGRDREVASGDAVEPGRSDTDSGCVRLVAERLERSRVVFAETAGDLARR